MIIERNIKIQTDKTTLNKASNQLIENVQKEVRDALHDLLKERYIPVSKVVHTRTEMVGNELTITGVRLFFGLGHESDLRVTVILKVSKKADGTLQFTANNITVRGL